MLKEVSPFTRLHHREKCQKWPFMSDDIQITPATLEDILATQREMLAYMQDELGSTTELTWEVSK